MSERSGIIATLKGALGAPVLGALMGAAFGSADAVVGGMVWASADMTIPRAGEPHPLLVAMVAFFGAVLADRKGGLMAIGAGLITAIFGSIIFRGIDRRE